MKLRNHLKEIRVMGSKCKVSYERGLDRGANFGVFDPQNNKIQIADEDSITEDAKLSTILHEVIEALNCKLELNLEHNQISSLESGLFQVLMDNPDFLFCFLELS